VDQFVVPRTPVEQDLADIWREILGLDRIGVNENFFELGGHSLVVTQLLARVRSRFSVELPFRVVFESPTIAELAVIIAQKASEQTNQDQLLQLLEEIENLADDEVQSLLSDDGGRG
jgi:acyl carrier protein